MCVYVGGQLNLTTINELFSARKLTFSMHNCTYKLDNRRGVTQSNYRVHQHVHYIAILCTGTVDNYVITITTVQQVYLNIVIVGLS